MNATATPHFITAGGAQMRLWRTGTGAPVVVLPGLVRAARVVADELGRVAPDLDWRVL